MEVTVHYLFSNNHLIGSRAIVWGTNHLYELDNKGIPSHVAILINEKWVLESTLNTGVRVEGYSKWLSHNNEVAKIECKEQRYWEDIKIMFKETKDQKYDWAGVIYLGIWLAINKVTGLDLPSDNAIHNEDKYFCCEVMAKMTGLDYQMTPPVKIMVDLKALL
jgi:hypothetical protein